MYDYIIVGAGPAGLQLGHYFEKENKNYLVLEKGGKAGVFFDKYPVHRKLISINKVYTGYDCFNLNLRWDWNSLLSDKEVRFGDYSQDYFPNADVMVEYLNDYAKANKIRISYNANVEVVSKTSRGFTIKLADGRVLETKYVVVATGLSEQRIPDIPGIENAVSYGEHSLDLELYKNKRVMILGKGNSAFETADHISSVAASIHLVSPNPLKLAWSTHYVGNLRAVNNNILDTYQLKSQNTILDGDVEKIQRVDDGFMVDIKYSHANGQRIRVPVDHIIICSGFKFSSGIFDESCSPEMCAMKKYPKMTCKWESTNVPGMYFVGTITHSRDYKKAFSGFIHGFRYNAKLLNDILNKEHSGIEFPMTSIESSGESLKKSIMARIHRNSSLFQQPGFICDYIGLEGNNFQYYSDMSVDYVNSHNEFSSPKHLKMTMEYGKVKHADPFNIERKPDSGEDSDFIHPVIRLYEHGVLKGECHIPEDLENNWYQGMYQDILQNFIENALGLEFENNGQLAPCVDYLNKVTMIL
ncbi:NAD(P)-binding domain-containing protein [Gilvimarinus sp. SDUM040013]|uniref:NAD(P)-binding domain-containing protein n=1 Tax=Gilvimarinus gilvus TaxID=3058038 RepID=A0ABU4S6A1_9GAMM|nr:NAD(P)-binding domain-containing protein [Gilvimarinus sp. SDUM040013]MDO3387181.1 NAD(P)-binding domain-containing protein [Gilvimarinus sp. SDUM040013]MDX6851438.1 NAD(P)-binding domain-containing protein [Gilvimarinus sp. SDUM040013]